MSRLVAVLLFGALLAALPAAAQQQRGRPPAPGAQPPRGQGEELRPLNSILQGLRGRIGGRLLDADLSAGPGGRSIYTVRTLERDGRERIFTIDARSGEILGERGGR
jgi:uncharacterized membrane protein YkoI